MNPWIKHDIDGYFLFKQEKVFREAAIIGGRWVCRTARFGELPYLLSVLNVTNYGIISRATPDEMRRWLADVYCVIYCVPAAASTLGNSSRGAIDL